jgi:hypothetical protein
VFYGPSLLACYSYYSNERLTVECWYIHACQVTTKEQHPRAQAPEGPEHKRGATISQFRGPRQCLDRLPELVQTTSCSVAFGLYRQGRLSLYPAPLSQESWWCAHQLTEKQRRSGKLNDMTPEEAGNTWLLLKSLPIGALKERTGGFHSSNALGITSHRKKPEAWAGMPTYSQMLP